MLLVDRLPADAEATGDLLPRPAAAARVVDLQHLEPLDQVAQRPNGSQANLRVGAGGVAGEVGTFGHPVNVS
jgi:hypothetical protein